jgi:hypothetical protein
MYSNYNHVIFLAIFIFVSCQPESCKKPPSSLHDRSRSSPLHPAGKGAYCCRGLRATWQNQGNSKAAWRAAKRHSVLGENPQHSKEHFVTIKMDEIKEQGFPHPW